MMVKFNRVECLSHPVCLNFLRMKWCAYGMWFHSINLIVYLVYLASLTAFIVHSDKNDLIRRNPVAQAAYTTELDDAVTPGITVNNLNATVPSTTHTLYMEPHMDQRWELQ